jgi:prepilin signal peptidase PulO-like enzyme (type II secretory pathway)
MDVHVTDSLVCVIVSIFLLYGAIWDARKRIIPDIVPIALFFIGIAAVFAPGDSMWNIPLSGRIAGFALPAFAMLFLYSCGKPVGGGDMKLSVTLGFLLGLTQFAIAYAIGGVIALAWAGIRKQKTVPLGTFLAIGVAVCLFL